MADPVSWFMVEPGWRVLAADGSEIGTVEDKLGDEELDIFDGLAVSTSLLSKATYVPSEHVDEIREGQVRLALSAQEVAALETLD